MHVLKSLKDEVYSLVDSKSTKLSSKIVQGSIVIMILLNVFSLVLVSVKEIREDYFALFLNFKLFSIAFFTIEYLVRLWTITSNPAYSHPIKGRIRYSFTSMQVIDLLAILPFYLSFVHIDLRILKILRVFRLLRIFRISSYIPALAIIVSVLRRKSAELLISAILLFFLLLIASSAMYYAENAAQPIAFSSIPESMWWSVITMSTVGYGDVYPVTTLGRILGGFISVIGIGFFALPTSILTSGFNEVLQERKKTATHVIIKKAHCPTCGQSVDE